MASTDLLFGKPGNPPGGPVEIVFGDDDGLPPGAVELQASGRITGLRGHVAARVVVRMGATGRITGLRGHVGGRYDINVDRSMVGINFTRFEPAQPLRSAVSSVYQQSLPLRAPVVAKWQDATPAAAPLVTRWQDSARVRAATLHVDQQARPLGTAPLWQGWQNAQRLRAALAQRFEQARRLGNAPVLQGFEDAHRLRHALVQRFQVAQQLGGAVLTGMGNALQLRNELYSRYQEAWAPRPGISPGPVQPQPEPCYLPELPAHLVFDETAGDGAMPVGLVFFCERHDPGPQPGETIVIPVRRTYIVINDITLYRVDSGVELQADSFSMSLDEQSWTWSWNASLNDDAAPHLGRDSAGDPAELAVFVNGIEFRLRLESRARDRRFNPTKWAVSGRGKASVLGASDTPKQSFRNLVDRTAQQLIADVLTVNGVPMGWSVDWGLEDWLVPAGAWAVHGTYMDAINDIAGAAGGYVQPHNTAATLRILPRYPLAPWNWSSITPAFEIPADAAEVEGTEFIDKPAYNRVFVGGISTGVFGPYTRAGSAGNVIAPQVNHSLITHADVHRQRGMAELSDTGKQQRLTLSMQVLPTSGVIMPGQFVRYLGDSQVMGIVRRTAVGGLPRLRQTLEIEVHA